jgi:phage terminase large subunit-like protein
MGLPAKYGIDTANWIRCPSDDVAARSGMVMDLERAMKVVEWIETNCCLYEGDRAGEKIVLLKAWRDFIIRLFGWVRWSKKWNCWVRRFNRAGFWGAKKNGKSPMLAALNLYLLCGDGEPGQKVYLGALNGDQARISQLHTVNMVRQSPQLNDVCKINNTTLNIRHLPTNSNSIIITGDNKRGQKAKEGFNGSVLFDEMHVVADEMWRRVSRAGISRRQPLLLSVSTSGDDRNCIGYEWTKRGRDAAEHRPGREDLGFLHVEYQIPEEVSEIEIAEEPEKWLPLANPAWGEIIDPEEIVNDCRVSYAAGGREWAKFLQYRANRWIGSVNRWLDINAWNSSREEFTLEDMRGRECFLGLDLARRLDMVGAAFIFPWPEGDGESSESQECVRIWPIAWLNEETVRLRDPVYGLAEWGRQGFLRVTPGNTTDFGRVKKDIRAAVNDHGLSLRGVFFDKTYAEELTQQLVDGEESETGVTIATGFGCERIAVGQDIRTLTSPSCEFERLIKKRMVRHPGNPVLDWQIENVEAYTDVNQNVRPVKPEPHSGKSVDLILAAVMGLLGKMTDTAAEPRVWRL